MRLPALRRRKWSLLLALVLLPMAAGAGSAGPVGIWQTVDDDSGEPRALVEITDHDGELRGRIVALIDPPKPDPVCEKCEGDRRGQPIEGMEILWGLSRDGDTWSGGRILDPESGKTYRARLQLADEGKTLKLRGYIGLALIGRTQTWHRHEQGTAE